MMNIGATDYRNGANERLREALLLLRHERFAGTIYIAGRAVEAMLRSIIWKVDRAYATGAKSLETGHNLVEMLRLIRKLGVLRDRDPRGLIAENILHVNRLWSNNLRFLSTPKVKAIWYNLGEVSPRRTLKQAVRDYFDACVTIMRECEALWQG